MNLEIVSQQLRSSDFVLKTQRQITKDFSTAGVDFPSDFQTNPYPVEMILTEVSVRLKELDSANPSGFSQLLYQIDVPESLLSNLSGTDDFYSDLAEVVLKREAYKVYLREKFS